MTPAALQQRHEARKNTAATLFGLAIIVTIACLALFGCSQLGLAKPEGFDQQLAEAYGVHTAVVQATTAALTAGTISADEAQQVETQAVSSRAMLDTAKSIEQTNPAGAQKDLTLAVSALTALQTYLNGSK